MITGSHTVISTKDAEADRAFLRDVLAFPHADAGDGWLIFGLPPSEVAFHPAEASGEHRFYLMCDDVQAFVLEMRRRGRACTPPQDEGWGVVTELTLPGGGMLGVYEPRHARPRSARVAKSVVGQHVRRAVEAGGKAKPKTRPARSAKRKSVKKKARRR
jgi:hypothetical protein